MEDTLLDFYLYHAGNLKKGPLKNDVLKLLEQATIRTLDYQTREHLNALELAWPHFDHENTLEQYYWDFDYDFKREVDSLLAFASPKVQKWFNRFNCIADYSPFVREARLENTAMGRLQAKAVAKAGPLKNAAPGQGNSGFAV